MKVGVTGPNGFIGSHLVQRLKKETVSYEIFDKTKYNLFDPKTLKDFVSKCDVIVHLAAKNIDTNENIIKTNTWGTTCLLEAIIKYSPKTKIIFLSSFQVYSEKSLYGLSKKFAEELIEHYAKNYSIKGIVLRLSNIYGPGCKPFYNSVIATFVNLIKKNKALEVNGDGSQKRDYLYIDDVIDAILSSIKERQQREKIEYFDICSGKLTSLKEIVNKLEKIVGKKVQVNYKKNAFTGKEIEIKNYKKANRLLGWRPKVSLEKGLGKLLLIYNG